MGKNLVFSQEMVGVFVWWNDGVGERTIGKAPTEKNSKKWICKAQLRHVHSISTFMMYFCILSSPLTSTQTSRLELMNDYFSRYKHSRFDCTQNLEHFHCIQTDAIGIKKISWKCLRMPFITCTPKWGSVETFVRSFSTGNSKDLESGDALNSIALATLTFLVKV